MAITAADLRVRLSADGASETKRAIQDVGSAVDSAGKKGGNFVTNVMGTAGGFLLAQGFTALSGGLLGLGGSFLSANADMEMYQSQLEVATGSTEAATKVFDNMKQLAAATPFEFPELVNAARLLESFGQSSEKWIPVIGDTAAATGKSINQVTEALLDAQTGEFERLKELGIRTKVEGDKVRFSYMKNGKEMVVETENNSEAISAALMGIWDENYDGAMEKMSNTFTGRLSTLKDNINMMMQDATKPLFDLAKAGLGWANMWFEQFDVLRAKGLSPLNAAVLAFSQVVGKAFGPKGRKVVDKFIDGITDVVSVVRRVADLIGDALGKAFGFLGDHMDKVLPALKGIAVAFAALAGMGFLTGILSAIGAAFAFLLSPIALLIAAAAALGIAWENNFLGIRDIVGSVADWVVDKFGQLLDAFTQFTDAGMNPLMAGLRALETVFPKTVAVIEPLIQIARDLKDAFDAFRAGDYAGALSAIGDAARVVLDAIGNIDWGGFLSGAWNVLQAGVQMAWDAITSLEWSDFVPVLDWALWIGGKIADFGGWLAGKVADLPWTDIIVKVTTLAAILMDKIGAFAWNDVIVPVYNLAQYLRDKINTLSWPDVVIPVLALGTILAEKIPNLNWTDIIVFGSLAFLGVLAAKIPNVDWDNFLSVMTWDNFVTALDWLNYINPINWGVYIGDLLWDTFIDDLLWDDVITDMSWSDWMTVLDWTKFLTPAYWIDYIADLAWDTFVPDISWGDFIPNLSWPSPQDILDRMFGGGDQGQYSEGGANDVTRDTQNPTTDRNGNPAVPVVPPGGFNFGKFAGGAGGLDLSWLGNLFGGSGSGATGFDTSWIAGVITQLSDLATTITNTRQSFVTFVADTVGVMGGWQGGITTIVTGAMGPFRSTISSGTSTGKQSFLTFVADVIGVMGGWSGGLQNIVSSALSAFRSTISSGTSTGKSSFLTFVADTIGVMGGWSGGMRNIVSGAMNGMTSAARAGASAMASALRSGANDAANGVQAALSRIPGIVASVGNSAASVAFSIGANISSAFASGMMNSLGAIQAAAGAMVAAADTALRAKAAIASPSKLFRQLGGYVGEGFEAGIRAMIPDVARATAALVSTPGLSGPTAYAAMPALYSAPRGGTSTSSVTNVTVYALKSEEWLDMVQKAESAPARAVSAMLAGQQGVL